MHDKDTTQEICQWEAQFDGDEALQKYLRGKEKRMSEYRIIRAKYGYAESDIPSAVRATAMEGLLLDRDELGSLEPTDDAAKDDSVIGESEDPDAMEYEINDDIISDDEQTGSEAESDQDEEAEDEPAGPAFGESPYFESTSYFNPSQSNTSQTRCEESYFPFESEVEALFYILCNSPTVRFSRAQLKMVWFIITRLNPQLRIPSIDTIMKMRHSLPRPKVGRFYTASSHKPYYQVSILDLVRMQLGVPGNRPAELPEVVKHANTGKRQIRECWNGSKWRYNSELQPPVYRLPAQHQVRDVWIGDVVKLTAASRQSNEALPKYAMFTGAERHERIQDGGNNYTTLLQTVPLAQGSQGAQFMIRTKCGAPLVNEKTVILVHGHQVEQVIPAKVITSMTGFDFDTKREHALEAPIFDQLRKEHPLRQHYEQGDRSTPIRVVNLNIWNDGMSGVTSSRWNPYEIWTVSMAGNPHRSTNPLSSCVFVSAGKDIHAPDMIPSIVEEFKRLQRGITAFDANIKKWVFVCGSLLLDVGDNSAASALCSHKWQSAYPCRVCMYCPAKVKKGSDILDVTRLRELEDTKADAGLEDIGIKTPLTQFYDLPGLNPHFDWTYEILHSAFLGYVKYLWKHTLQHQALKKKEKLAAILDASSYDSFSSRHRLSGRRAIRWSGSFAGPDFRVLVQILPLSLIAMFRSEETWESVRPLVNLWCAVSKVTKLLCMHQIPDVDFWTQEFTGTVEMVLKLWTEQYGVSDAYKKIKLHQLAHVPFWVRRFGPPMVGIAERNEAANKHIRGQLALSNRLSGSRDCAARYAAICGLQYMAQGGLWRENKNGVEFMTSAGRKLLDLFSETAVKQNLGIATADSIENGAKVYKEDGSCKWENFSSTTSTSALSLGHNFRSSTTFRRFQRFDIKTGDSTSTSRGKGGIGTFVRIIDDASSNKIFRVESILRLEQGKACFLTVRQFSISKRDSDMIEEVQCFEERSGSRPLIICLEQVEEVLNVQHLCTAECSTVSSPAAYSAEREVVAGLVWHHHPGGIWMLNHYIL